MTRSYAYRREVLDALASHGVQPASTTPPGLVGDFVSDLYSYELRKLRAALLAGRIPKPQYAAHVLAVRKRYRILSRPLIEWTMSQPDD